MNKKYLRKRLGVTLIELILAMSLIGMIITISANMMNLSTKSHKVTVDEYQLQSDIRLATEKTNKIIRYSSALFTIPMGRFFEANLTDGWNYLGILADGKEIVSYTYESRLNADGDLELKHWKDIVVPTHNNLEYEIVFEKETTVTGENIIKYSFVIKNEDNNNVRMAIDSEIEALNALQVVDRGTAVTPAVAIAYRADARPQDQIVGVISMVLDNSGSMAKALNGANNNVANEDKRIYKLRTALKSMIDEFSKEEFIEIALVPFSRSANSPDTTSQTANGTHAFYKPNEAAGKSSLLDIANNLKADGGTNTGDGMRRAYFRNKYFADNITTIAGYGTNFGTREYMIILVDGVTTMASTLGTTSGSRSYKMNDGYHDNLTWHQNSSNWHNKGIIGNGSSTHADTNKYVELIGALIKSRNTKVYVIGFSSVTSELNSVNDIATAAGALSKNVYKFTDNLDLEEVFVEIKDDIMKDLWHVRGPKL